MLGERVQIALNEQVKYEMNSAYLYLAMAAFYSSRNLDGFASWMNAQAQEELSHAMKLFRYIAERGGRVRLQQIDAPPVDFASPLAPFEQAFEHEKCITGKINELYTLAMQEHDYALQVFLQWFISEQVEEEANVGNTLDMLNMLGDSQYALLMADRELARRSSE